MSTQRFLPRYCRRRITCYGQSVLTQNANACVATGAPAPMGYTCCWQLISSLTRQLCGTTVWDTPYARA